MRHSSSLFLSVFFMLTIAIVYISFSYTESAQEELLHVYYLDIGQGDATFIESPSGVQILIDGGPGVSVLRELGGVMGFFDRDIDLVVATHPDQDHIGGLIDVLRRYRVNAILLTENESATPASQAFLNAVAHEGAAVLYARSGQVFDLGSGHKGSITLEILFPDRDPSGLESNTSSIVTQLRYGETEFIFTGDSPQSVEEYLVDVFGPGLRSEVLKVGHHGSKTSTAETFVSSVAPDVAIISAGKNNRYGHPHKEALDLLRDYGIKIKNTAEEGRIEVVSDGVSVVVK